MNLGNLLENKVKRYPDKIAVVYGDERYTYAEFNSRINSLANRLLRLGVRKQERVCIICHNSNCYLEIVFACAKIGVVSAHLNWRLSVNELERLISRAEYRYVFISKRFECAYKKLAERLPGLTFFAVDGDMDGDMDGAQSYESLLENESSVLICPEPAAEDIVFQIYTSGTTGMPKGVMLSHKSVCAHILTNIIDTCTTHNERYLCVLPLFHASSSGAYNALIAGGCTVILNRFDAGEYLLTAEKNKVTRLGLTPAMLSILFEDADLSQYDLSSVNSVVYGGAPISVKLLQKAVDYLPFKFYQLFGMTEMGPVVSVLMPEDHSWKTDKECRHLLSAGKAATGVYIRIVNDGGNDCPPDIAGEIITKSDAMMAGYYMMEAETKSAVINGWYYTGDIGYFDEDGYLYVSSRKVDMIVSGGENIYPKEVENCIAELSDFIAEVAVIGVPDSRWGEAVKAIVVRKKGSRIKAEDIILHCRKNIAGYKKPKSVDFVNALPRNDSGKVQKNILREKYWEGYERKI